MYIDKQLWQIVKKNIKGILMTSLWTFLPVITDGLRFIAWGILILHLTGIMDILPIWGCIMAIFLSVILQRSCEHLLTLKKSEISNIFKYNFRKELFEKLFVLGPAFIDKKTTGEIITTMWEKVEWVSYYLFLYIPTSLVILLLTFVLAVLFFTYSVPVSFAILARGVTVTFIPVILKHFVKNDSSDEWKENDEFYSVCLDGMQGISTLKALNADEMYYKKVSGQAEKNRKQIMRNLIKTTLNTRLIELCIIGCEAGCAILEIWTYIKGLINPCEMIIIYMLIKTWVENAGRIYGAWLRGNKGMAAYESAASILDTKSEYSLISLEEKNKNIVFSQNSEEIRFEKVSFSYSDDSMLTINDVNLAIERGTKVALVGSSGSGKTSMIRLIFGLYKPQNGTISIEGIDMNSISVKAIQDLMTVIWQDSHIFNMSCMENIRIAYETASDEEVYAAAKKANIHERILKLPEGYNTIIGDGGMTLSGGEKQRITLARAFLRNTPILILDEATSSLDRKNEEQIQNCINELSKGKTVVMVAHRLDTVKNADLICIMDKGRIIEKGTHEELVDVSQRYKEIMGIVRT